MNIEFFIYRIKKKFDCFETKIRIGINFIPWIKKTRLDYFYGSNQLEVGFSNLVGNIKDSNLLFL